MRTAIIRKLLVLPAAVLLLPLLGVPSATAADGKAIYEKANCVGCHKWHGGGGGGYGGAALSLRTTQLERDQLVEVVRCGRPGTRMPFHDKNAWSSGECYGTDPKTLGDEMPPQAAEFLSEEEIASVADYVTANQKGKDKPDRADCVSFWGEGAKQCQSYK
ncbi:c-type cytochrome [Skermanella pratensis]|uniref:c-type cytochrome n=1 Tax=Skermanella pratensis TaxID=2233999 RepID=UPI001787B349|nr:cytochrome c [Skermanella pratensis]